MSRNNSHKVTSIISRLKGLYGVKTDSDLAIKLDVDRTVIANWKRRDSINANMIISKCHQFDLNFIFYGNILTHPDKAPDEQVGNEEDSSTEIEKLKAQVALLKEIIISLKVNEPR